MNKKKPEAGGDESRIAEFLARYEPTIAAEADACRRRLQKRVARGYELVYDNYNALVFGFSPTERTSDALMSIAVYPRWVTLFLLQGAGLVDPEGRLAGSGTRVRHVRLASVATLEEAAVQDLITQVLSRAQAAFAAAPPLKTTVRSVSAKQRPRRPG